MDSLKTKYIQEVTDGSTDSFDMSPMEVWDWIQHNAIDLGFLNKLGYELICEDEFMYFIKKVQLKHNVIDYVIEASDCFYYCIHDLAGASLADVHPDITFYEFITWSLSGKIDI